MTWEAEAMWANEEARKRGRDDALAGRLPAYEPKPSNLYIMHYLEAYEAALTKYLAEHERNAG